MSNSLINIRFGEYHLHVDRDFPWVRIGWNSYHKWARRTDPNWKWFEIMEWHL